MRTKDLVSPNKLRGGFYSPDVLVDLCTERASELLGQKTRLRILEPSAGDGAFFRGIARSELYQDVDSVTAIELIEEEAAKAAHTLRSLNIKGNVINENVLRWAQNDDRNFNLLLANPPYVRFQFISETDKQLAKTISSQFNINSRAVSNLWIPVFILSLGKLNGGVFSVILPAEFLTGVSAGVVRNWILANTTDMRIDLFKPGSFPSVLQEVLVLSGRKYSQNSPRKHYSQIVRFHDHNGTERVWEHNIKPGTGTWTNYLLSPEQNDIFSNVSSTVGIQKISDVAKFSVSTVTGANGYFCLSSEEVDRFDLWKWAIPMLSKARYSKGVIFNDDDRKMFEETGSPAWMLSFSADKPSPENYSLAKEYLDIGEKNGINLRYKCRVRYPWYRVPIVPAGDLLLSKRSHFFPQVISNHAGVLTTDTIYRGQVFPGETINADDFATVFHNSLTMLSAEILGRSFGGGVLELVPSEVNSLRVPVVPGAERHILEIDKISRKSNNHDDLLTKTDELLTKFIPTLDKNILSVLHDARNTLLSRRMQRTNSNFYL